MKLTEEHKDCYTHFPVVGKQPPRMLEFKLRNGSSFGISYSWFQEWELSGNNTALTLTFSFATIVMKGRNLEEIKTQLNKQMLISVEEVAPSAETIPEGSPIVTSIERLTEEEAPFNL